ncbi:MAG: RnfABCDGE type electron transport complex subunit D [Lentisphaeria bacterium]|nr:RnfABCDGE type electron transport complex subunit D [Lentisphaeria bacterium]
MSENTIRLPDTSQLVISSSPHLHDDVSVRRIMFTVIAALLPACLAGAWYFGPRAVWVLLVCVASCIACEILSARLIGRDVRVADGSAALTGLLLGMNLPVTTPAWVCVIGSAIAIVLGKMIYGGLGYNPFNPALVGRVALLLAFPTTMTTWVAPLTRRLEWAGVDSVTQATPLGVAVAEAGPPPFPLWDLFIGRTGGSLGETCVPALLLGGLVLIALRIIRWQVPVCFLATVAVMAGVTHWLAPAQCAPPLYHLFSGGLVLGAFFMATDMVTTPLSRKGAVLFAVGCGVLTSVIRIWGSYPEGVSFSILIMNSLTPLIDRWTAGKPFGAPRHAPREVKP